MLPRGTTGVYASRDANAEHERPAHHPACKLGIDYVRIVRRSNPQLTYVAVVSLYVNCNVVSPSYIPYICMHGLGNILQWYKWPRPRVRYSIVVYCIMIRCILPPFPLPGVGHLRERRGSSLHLGLGNCVFVQHSKQFMVRMSKPKNTIRARVAD